MRVAIVHQPLGPLRLPATTGSIEVWVFEVARRLAKSNDVLVYSIRASDQTRSETYEGVRYCRISTPADDCLLRSCQRHPKLRRLLGFVGPKRPLFAAQLAYLEYAIRVAADVRRQRCDLVHVLNFSQLVPVIRAFNPHVKIVLHMQCEWLSQLDPQMIKRRLGKCDLVVGCSEFITRRIRNAFPELAGRCHTLYNGVDVKRFVPEERESKAKGNKRLVFVGRIWADKGPHVLIQAFNEIVKHHPETRLEFIGWKTGPPKAYLVGLTSDEYVGGIMPLYNRGFYRYLERITSPEAAARVSYCDALPHAELAQRLKDASIAIFPSVWNEPFGMVIVEAMSCGVPVIATAGGGIPEIVEDGTSGLLVPRGDSAALAGAIIRLLEDEELRKPIGKAARERVVQNFSWDKIASDTLRYYHDGCVDFGGRESSQTPRFGTRSKPGEVGRVI